MWEFTGDYFRIARDAPKGNGAISQPLPISTASIRKVLGMFPRAAVLLRQCRGSFIHTCVES